MRFRVPALCLLALVVALSCAATAHESLLGRPPFKICFSFDVSATILGAQQSSGGFRIGFVTKVAGSIFVGGILQGIDLGSTYEERTDAEVVSAIFGAMRETTLESLDPKSQFTPIGTAQTRINGLNAIVQEYANLQPTGLQMHGYMCAFGDRHTDYWIDISTDEDSFAAAREDLLDFIQSTTVFTEYPPFVASVPYEIDIGGTALPLLLVESVTTPKARAVVHGESTDAQVTVLIESAPTSAEANSRLSSVTEEMKERLLPGGVAGTWSEISIAAAGATRAWQATGSSGTRYAVVAWTSGSLVCSIGYGRSSVVYRVSELEKLATQVAGWLK